jgi:hypothetical protein
MKCLILENSIKLLNFLQFLYIIRVNIQPQDSCFQDILLKYTKDRANNEADRPIIDKDRPKHKADISLKKADRA